MRSSKRGRKTSGITSTVWHVAPSYWNQMLPISSSSIFVNKNSVNMARSQSLLTITASPCSFSKKNYPIMPLDQNPHQTVTRFGCIGFSVYACGFSVPQMQQLCLFTYPPRSEWASCEKMIFFFAKIGIFYMSLRPSVVQAYTQPYSFGGNIKLIICQMTHKLSVTIHEISTRWKKC